MPLRRDDLDEVEESDGGPDNPDTQSNNVHQDMSTAAFVQRPQPQPRRRPSSHIPRPPNAFILFRSSFIRSNHVPGKVEGNHSTLSKIIGLCWKALSPEERQTWEEKARIAQAEHRNLYPDWRWRPEANSLAKKRGTRKRKITYVQPSKQGDDGQDGQETHKNKGKLRDKGKSRERSSDDDIDPDARIVKIAELLKQGITGADLERALNDWQHTLSNQDPRPTKQPRIRLTQDVTTTLDASAPPQSQAELFAPNPSELSPSPQASGSANLSFPPNIPSNKSLTHVLNRSSPDSARTSDLPPLSTESISLITRSYSHTPSPHTPFYTSHHPSHSIPRPDFTPETSLTWVENTTPASFSNSQPSFSQYWASHLSTHPTQTAPFDRCYEAPAATTEGLGYEDTSAFDQRYSEQFEHSRDDSERVEWTRNAGRQGLCAVITDPLPSAENLPTNPPAVLIPSRGSAVSNNIPSTSSDRSFFTTDPPTASATTFIPSTYSTLTGWAGEYDNRIDEAYSGMSALEWYPRNWQDTTKAPMWNEESGNVDVSRPNPNVSHHKIVFPAETITARPPSSR